MFPRYRRAGSCCHAGNCELAVRPDQLPAALRVRDLPTVADADVLVAIDQASIPAAWLFARQPRNVLALNGLPAAVARTRDVGAVLPQQAGDNSTEA